MEVPRLCKRSCDVLSLSSDPALLERRLRGLSLLSPPTGHISEPAQNAGDPEETPQKLSSTQSRFSCVNCNVEFPNVGLMRSHFKSAEHQAVLSRRFLRQVSDEDYNTLRDLTAGSDDDEEQSDSGSSSSSDEADEEEEAVTGGVERLQMDDSALDEHLLRHAKLYFRNEAEEIVAVHKCLLITKRQRPATLDALLGAASTLHTRLRWAFLMLSGGHFAAAVFDGATMQCHKTFRRYTTRQKQGGLQSGRDAQGGGRIRSAGAGLRRKNEAALTQEIQALLASWKEHLDACSLVFLRTPARKRSIFQQSWKRVHAGVGAAFSSDDLRVRSIPVTSKRPTLEEVRRVHAQLLSVEVYDKDARLDFISMSATRQGAAVRGAATSPARHAGGRRDAEPRQRRRQRRQEEFESALDAAASASDGEEEAALETVEEERHFARELSHFEHSVHGADQPRRASSGNASAAWINALYTATIYGDEEAVASCLRQAPGDEADTLGCLLELRGNPARTLLHDAVSAGSAAVVRLLLEKGCRPDIPNQQRQMPYELASKEVRAVFRRFMAEFPDRFDYRAAKVPAPLTAEMEAEKKAKTAEKRKAQKAQKRNRQAERKKVEREKEEVEKETKRFLDLTDSEKRREASSSGMRCFKCAASVEPRNRFEYYDSVFCSLRCLQAHKMGKR